jgi:hypothetical protein
MRAKLPLSETGPSGRNNGCLAFFSSDQDSNVVAAGATSSEALPEAFPGLPGVASIWYYGKKIADKLGLPLNELRYHRDDLLLKKGPDWKPLPGQRDFVMSRNTVDRLLVQLFPLRSQPVLTESDLSSCVVPIEEEKKGGLVIRVDGDKIEIRKW